MTWQHISSELTVKYFKFCISNAMDGTNDEMLWNNREEDGDVSNVRKVKTPDDL
jgi:hypothetical protein